MGPSGLNTPEMGVPGSWEYTRFCWWSLHIPGLSYGRDARATIAGRTAKCFCPG
jgi:hypothetical protein